jgi:hypothetical protein
MTPEVKNKIADWCADKSKNDILYELMADPKFWDNVNPLILYMLDELITDARGF